MSGYAQRSDCDKSADEARYGGLDCSRGDDLDTRGAERRKLVGGALGFRAPCRHCEEREGEDECRSLPCDEEESSACDFAAIGKLVQNGEWRLRFDERVALQAGEGLAQPLLHAAQPRAVDSAVIERRGCDNRAAPFAKNRRKWTDGRLRLPGAEAAGDEKDVRSQLRRVGERLRMKRPKTDDAEHEAFREYDALTESEVARERKSLAAAPATTGRKPPARRKDSPHRIVRCGQAEAADRRAFGVPDPQAPRRFDHCLEIAKDLVDRNRARVLLTRKVAVHDLHCALDRCELFEPQANVFLMREGSGKAAPAHQGGRPGER
ncbi:MAG: hypothetical protein M3188_06820 [Actinomycetota bacterium]|nr:hypothetical protein [Actinomycetota bacterium]